jgi:hypothetical protein
VIHNEMVSAFPLISAAEALTSNAFTFGTV